jgi:hypothetical protein
METFFAVAQVAAIAAKAGEACDAGKITHHGRSKGYRCHQFFKP